MTSFSKAPKQLQALVLVLLAEAAAVFAAFLSLAVELLRGEFQNFYAEVFLLALSFFAVLWILQFTRWLLGGRRWARSAAVFWQLLQVAIGASAVAENLPLGVSLIAAAAVAFGLLFSKVVVDFTQAGGSEAQ